MSRNSTSSRESSVRRRRVFSNSWESISGISQLRVVEVCKGTDRYRKPPVRLVKNEAPLRKYLGVHRQSQEIFESNGWEAWENWSNRKLVEKGQPARMLITMFGKSKASRDTPKRKQEERSRIRDHRIIQEGETSWRRLIPRNTRRS